MDFDQPPVTRAHVAGPPPDLEQWPWSIPAVAQLVREGLDLAPGVTFLVGENGSGKSTIVEGLATAFGLSPEGGTTQAHHATRPSESPLGARLRLQRGLGASRWGFFLRAETMHSWYTFLEHHPAPPTVGEPVFHEMSHGESFLSVLERRFDDDGFYCLDEPEAALSFSSTLALIATLQQITQRRAQVVCATHSPVLAALPGARILEVGDWGLRERRWDELELVWHWRHFLEGPHAYLRHLGPGA